MSAETAPCGARYVVATEGLPDTTTVCEKTAGHAGVHYAGADGCGGAWGNLDDDPNYQRWLGRDRSEGDSVTGEERTEAAEGAACSCGKPFPEDGGREGVCECCSGCSADV